MNTSWTDPFNERMEKRIFSSSLFQIVIGVFVGLVITGLGIYFITQTDGGNEEHTVLPMTGNEEVELSKLDRELEDIPGATEVEKIVRVGDEYLFVSDLSYFAYLELKRIDDLNDEEEEQAIDELIDQSIMLQSGAEEGWIELTSDVFNNPFKDYTKRGNLVMDIREKYNTFRKAGTHVEIVTVWFYNGELGSYAKTNGIEAAKEMAKAKIDEVYRLVTMEGQEVEKAAQVIINDSSLSQLDENYNGNAYGLRIFPYEINSIDDVGGSSSNLYDFLKDAQEGNLSKVFLEKDTLYFQEEIFIEAYYAFYKVKYRMNSFSDINEWIDSFKQNIDIEIL